MASRKEMGICERCGTKYLKCRFNKYHQKYCTRNACVVERRRERQRQHYRKMYRNDQTFTESERERCRNGITKRRAHARQTADQIVAESTVKRINIQLLTTGLLSQWIDSKDPEEVEQAARRLEKRGQQLALERTTARHSPILKDF